MEFLLLVLLYFLISTNIWHSDTLNTINHKSEQFHFCFLMLENIVHKVLVFLYPTRGFKVWFGFLDITASCLYLLYFNRPTYQCYLYIHFPFNLVKYIVLFRITALPTSSATFSFCSLFDFRESIKVIIKIMKVPPTKSHSNCSYRLMISVQSNIKLTSAVAEILCDGKDSLYFKVLTGPVYT